MDAHIEDVDADACPYCRLGYHRKNDSSQNGPNRNDLLRTENDLPQWEGKKKQNLSAKPREERIAILRANQEAKFQEKLDDDPYYPRDRFDTVVSFGYVGAVQKGLARDERRAQGKWEEIQRIKAERLDAEFLE